MLRHSKKFCKKGIECKNVDCTFDHPPERILCEDGNFCNDADCGKLHPISRKKVCARKDDCPNAKCNKLHSFEREASKSTTGDKLLKLQKEREKERAQKNLPIYEHKEAIIAQLKKEKVIIITAATGSGKTTQLPQYCAEEFSGLIVCTQPRVLAAVSIGERIAEEFDGTGCGENVGYKAGGKEKTGKRIMLMTDAALVKKAQNDMLSEVSVLIIDEAHERSLNTDLVMGIAKTIREKRGDNFYVIIASATIEPSDFVKHFKGDDNTVFPVQVEKPYRVEEIYDNDFYSADNLIGSVSQALAEYTSGNCLVFLQGSKEVDEAVEKFRNENFPGIVTYPLYGSLPQEEQSKVFEFDDNGGQLRMVVFCTNVAETSLTVPNTKIVIDSGLAKEAKYNVKRRITVLEEVYISKSNATQRRGRAGRTSAGVYIALYQKDDIKREKIEPEICRSSLDLVALQLRKLGHDPKTFPYVNAPDLTAINAAERLLSKFECIDANGKVTAQGDLFAELGFDPRISNFLVEAAKYQQLPFAAQLCCILTAPGKIFFMGGGKENKVDCAAKVSESASDHDSDLIFLQDTFKKWDKSGNGRICSKCKSGKGKIKGNKQGCSVCRSKFAAINGLNNKVLDYSAQNILSSDQNRRKLPRKVSTSTETNFQRC